MSASFIESVSIATNPNGDAVSLYSYNGCTGLTLGQLVSAVCCHAGDALDAQTVAVINRMTRGTTRLNSLAEIIEGIAKGTVDYDTTGDYAGTGDMTVREFLLSLGLTIATTDDGSMDGILPPAVDTIGRRIMFQTAVKSKVDTMTTLSQEAVIDLRTCLSRRDVAYRTATSTVQSLGVALQMNATNF